ncbi:MAG: hypothetical protein WDM81_04430 [Rhizomicrobium sp.]
MRDHTNYFCAGAHPDFTDTVLTFDLATGAPINVMDALKPDFVSGGMGKLYAARYRLPKKKDDDACRGWAGDPNNLSDPYCPAGRQGRRRYRFPAGACRGGLRRRSAPVGGRSRQGHEGPDAAGRPEGHREIATRPRSAARREPASAG